MTLSELPSLFPAVLSGECPLSVLADACLDCGMDGFVELVMDRSRCGCFTCRVDAVSHVRIAVEDAAMMQNGLSRRRGEALKVLQ